MDQDLAYKELYALQDMVLNIVRDCNTSFYLTGGTCLHRFLINRRYSDDLDFFCSDSNLFRDYARTVLTRLKNTVSSFQIEADTRDFIRININQSLKIDFVNDLVYREGYSQSSPQGYLLDNIENILANKISAIIGRDEPKDIFDVTSLDILQKIDWDRIMEIAQKKCLFEKDYLIYRLESFPINLLDLLAVIKKEYTLECKAQIPRLVAKFIKIG